MTSLSLKRWLFGFAFACIIILFSILTVYIRNFFDINQLVQYGVFLATAFSLFAYVAFSSWDKFLEEPDLSILHDRAMQDFYNPQMVILYPNRAPRERRFIRVIVKNRGSRTANRCLARLQLKQRPEGNHTLSTEPKTLIWPDTIELPNIPPQSEFAVNIAFSERGLNPAFRGACDGFIRAWICTRDAFNEPNFRLQDAMCRGDYRCTLTIFSDNSYPVSKDILIQVAADWEDLNMNLIED